MLLSSECPAARCLSCSTLYSTKFDRKVEEGERKHGIRTYGVYSEVVEYIPYTTYYICRECGNVEKSYSKERKLLSRTKIRGYIVNY